MSLIMRAIDTLSSKTWDRWWGILVLYLVSSLFGKWEQLALYLVNLVFHNNGYWHFTLWVFVKWWGLLLLYLEVLSLMMRATATSPSESCIWWWGVLLLYLVNLVFGDEGCWYFEEDLVLDRQTVQLLLFYLLLVLQLVEQLPLVLLMLNLLHHRNGAKINKWVMW